MVTGTGLGQLANRPRSANAPSCLHPARHPIRMAIRAYSFPTALPPRPRTESRRRRTRYPSALSKRTDEQLLEDYRGGDLEAFRLLIGRHHDDLLRFLIRLTGDRQAADDVFQEAFLQVHISADTFAP